LIKSAADKRINYIDTVWVYHLGASENIVCPVFGGKYSGRIKKCTFNLEKR
jgi:predicted aldo/keto reductase-like oxidoreductase